MAENGGSGSHFKSFVCVFTVFLMWEVSLDDTERVQTHSQTCVKFCIHHSQGLQSTGQSRGLCFHNLLPGTFDIFVLTIEEYHSGHLDCFVSFKSIESSARALGSPGSIERKKAVMISRRARRCICGLRFKRRLPNEDGDRNVQEVYLSCGVGKSQY